MKSWYKQMYTTFWKAWNKYILKACNLPNYTVKQHNLNRPIINKEIKAVIKNFPTKNRPRADGISCDFYQRKKNTNFWLQDE